MCEICRSYPCVPGCPSYTPQFTVCESCGATIRLGDNCVIDEDQDGMLLCDKCAEKLIEEMENRIDMLRYGSEPLTKEMLRTYEL